MRRYGNTGMVISRQPSRASINKRSTENASWENAAITSSPSTYTLEGGQLLIDRECYHKTSAAVSLHTPLWRRRILGEDTDNGISDVQCNMRSSPQVHDNEINTVAAPFVCSNMNTTENPLSYNNANVNKWPELVR